MKRFWLPIACGLLCATAAASASQTTIVGTWRWSNGSPAVFAADGTVRRNGQTGAWERQGSRYVITWFDSKPGMQNEIDSIETVTLSADGTSLHGSSGDGSPVNGALLSHAQIAVAAPAANRSAVAYAPAVSSVARSTAARPAAARALSEYTSGGAYGAASAASARPPAPTQSTSSSASSSASSGSSTAVSSSVAQAAQSSVQSAAAPASAPRAVPTVFTPGPPTSAQLAAASPYGQVNLNPVLLVFSAPQQVQYVTVSQSGYNGIFHASCGSEMCQEIVQVTPVSNTVLKMTSLPKNQYCSWTGGTLEIYGPVVNLTPTVVNTDPAKSVFGLLTVVYNHAGVC